MRAVTILTAAIGLLVSAGAFAQAWPTKPVRIIIPFAPGGVLDGLIRPLATSLGEALGQPVVPENRPGGNTAVGVGLCAKGAPDGYTLCPSGSGVLFNPMLYRNMDYSPQKDLAAITNMVLIDGVITVSASLPVHNMKELVGYAKANPGKLNFGSFGEGSPGHLYLEWIKNRTGVDIVHIAYKGAAPVIQAAISNEVQLIYMATGAILPHIRSGKVRPLVLPAEGRSKYLANVPTFAEEGYDFRPSSWFGLFAQAQTPRPIVSRVQAEVKRILFEPGFQSKVIEPQFYEAVGDTPEQFTAFLDRQRVLSAELVKISGMKPVDM